MYIGSVNLITMNYSRLLLHPIPTSSLVLKCFFKLKEGYQFRYKMTDEIDYKHSALFNFFRRIRIQIGGCSLYDVSGMEYFYVKSDSLSFPLPAFKNHCFIPFLINIDLSRYQNSSIDFELNQNLDEFLENPVFSQIESILVSCDQIGGWRP